MSSRATSGSTQGRSRNRAPKTPGDAQRLSRPASRAPDRPSRGPGTATGVADPTWERELNRLRRVSLVLGVILATVLVRMVVNGPTLLTGLAAGLIAALLLAYVLLWRWGKRLRRSAAERSGTTSDGQPTKPRLSSRRRSTRT